jgi:copper chaperone CopZ
MSSKREMKKINLESLDQVERKTSRVHLKRAGIAVGLLLAVAASAFGVHRLISGEVLASRFAVNKLTCPACVITVKEVTAKIPGVVEADVRLAAQDVTVKYRDGKTGPETIREAIEKAGYPIKLDGLFKPEGEGVDGVVIARVNGRAIFQKDMESPLNPEQEKPTRNDPTAAFFSVVGKEMLLQAADGKQIVIQPQEIEDEVTAMAGRKGIPREQLIATATKTYGSEEKFNQLVAQQLGIRRLLSDYVAEGITDPEKKERTIVAWIGTVFKDANVQILDAGLKGKLQASVGESDWKLFWPRMIGRDTELKRILVQ